MKAFHFFFLLLCTPLLAKTPDVTIIGPILMADGIGRQTAELADALMEDYQVQVIADTKTEEDMPVAVKSLLSDELSDQANIIILIQPVLPGPWGIGGVDRLDTVFDSVKRDDQIRFAYSMIESTLLPTELVVMLNIYLDAVIVPDPFLIDVYRNSGVKIPIFYIPLGVDLQNFLNRPLKQKKKVGPLIFANLSASFNRKNQILLVEAFAKALGNNEDAKLYINARSHGPGFTGKDTRKGIIKAIKKSKCQNIKYTNICFRKDAYLKVFEDVDCYVSLSTAEGFSIQPREAMALGIPVIATNNTGQTTICNTGLVRSVESKIKEPAYYYSKSKELSSGYRFNCSVNDAAKAFKDVYNNYEHYLSKGEEARKWASQYCYSNKALTEQYKSLVKPKTVILGTENRITKEGIVTNSQELVEKYKRLILEEF